MNENQFLSFPSSFKHYNASTRNVTLDMWPQIITAADSTCLIHLVTHHLTTHEPVNGSLNPTQPNT